MSDNPLNDLMAELEKDPVAFGQIPQNSDRIITAHRNMRKMMEGGWKPSKKKDAGVKIEASALLDKLGMATPAVPKGFTRRM